MVCAEWLGGAGGLVEALPVGSSPRGFCRASCCVRRRFPEETGSEQVAGSCKSLISVSLPGALWLPAALSWDELSETDGVFFFNYFLLCLSVSKDKHSSPLASAPGTGKLYSTATLCSSLLRAQAPDLQFDSQTVKLPPQLLPRTLCFVPNRRSCHAAPSSLVPDAGIFPGPFPVCSGSCVTLRASG